MNGAAGVRFHLADLNAREANASRRVLKSLVRPVAIRLVARVLAAAQPELFGFLHLEFDRRKLGALVRTVAERLGFRSAAAAPPVLARGEFHRVRGLLRYVGFGHFLSFCGYGIAPPRAGV